MAARGVSTVTHPPQNDIQPCQPTNSMPACGGEDWFEGAVYLTWDAQKAAEVFAALDKEKGKAATHAAEQADKGRRHRKPQPFARLPGSNGQWMVQPFGMRMGDAAKGPLIRWVLERDGVKFGMMHRVEPHKTQPSGFFRFTGETMIAVGGVEQAWEKVKTWFAELGATITDSRVSRVDPCVDIPGVGVDELCEAMEARNVVTRVKAANEDTYVRLHRTVGMKRTGLTMGVGTMLRVYDKAIECRDLAKRAWMIHKRWGGADQTKALRVEFQLRREFLGAKKNKGDADGMIGRPVIDTVEDYLAHRAELVKYLTTAWVRFVEPRADDLPHTYKTKTRAESLPIWKRVQSCFEAWAGEGNRGEHQQMPREYICVDPLIIQAIGCLESAAAAVQFPVNDPVDFLAFARSHLATRCANDPCLKWRVAHKVKSMTKVVRRPIASFAEAFSDPCDETPVAPAVVVGPIDDTYQEEAPF